MTTETDPKQIDVVWEREIEELFRKHYKFMYRAAKAVTRREADAEDVIQNLFLKFVQHELRPEVRANPKGYLHRAAVNAALNMIRTRNRRKETDGVEKLELAEPGAVRANDNVQDKLRDTFTELKPDVVQIVILHCEHGYSDTEIARLLGQSRSKIASILCRVRTRLKKALGKPDESAAPVLKECRSH